MGNNQITDVVNYGFSNLPALRKLDLSKNKLVYVSEGMFSELPLLSNLDLRGNALRHVSHLTFNRFPAFSELGIDRSALQAISSPILYSVKRIALDEAMPHSMGLEMAIEPMLVAAQPPSRDTVRVHRHERRPLGPSKIRFKVRASRLFAAPKQYPPHSFAAYGIIAFRSQPIATSQNRYLKICEGFLASMLPHYTLIREDVPLSNQLATVWPLSSEVIAKELNERKQFRIYGCEEAVNNIDHSLSQNAISLAERSMGSQLVGDGPFLLAWSPGTGAFQKTTVMLSLDFSNVRNSEQATRMFQFWIDEIEKEPEVWNSGWNMERIRLKIMLAADKMGEQLLQLIHGRT